MKLWLGLFALWALFLSGLAGFPGVLQAARLNGLLQAKHKQLSELQSEISRMQGEAAQLEKNRIVQLREIRRVLGYAAPGEVIFDFSAGDAF